MTVHRGVYSHHSARGANLRTSHKGTDRATSQKTAPMNPMTAAPKNRS